MLSSGGVTGEEERACRGYLWGFYEEQERASRSLPTQPFYDWEIRSLLTCCSALILCNKKIKKKNPPKAIISGLKEKIP